MSLLTAIPTTHKHIRPSRIASLKADKAPRAFRGVATSPVTFSAWLQNEGVPANTSRSYISDLAILTSWFEDHNRPEHFDPRLLSSSDIRAWRHYALEIKGWMPATWNRRRAFVAVYSRYLKAMGINSTDLLRGVDRASQQNDAAPRWPNQSEFHRLERWLEHAEADAHTPLQKALARRNVAMLALMGYAGLREFEVVKLTRGNITLSERKGSVDLYGKRQIHRAVPLCSELRHWLEIFFSALGDLPADARLFDVKPRQLQNITAAAGRDCQINGLTPHRLRHAFGKKLDRAGASVAVAQKLLGHSRREMTERYQAPGQEELEDAVEAASYADLPKGRECVR